MRVQAGVSPVEVEGVIEQIKLLDLGLEVDRNGSLLALTGGTLTDDGFGRLKVLLASKRHLVRPGVNQSRAGTFARLARRNGGGRAERAACCCDAVNGRQDADPRWRAALCRGAAPRGGDCCLCAYCGATSSAACTDATTNHILLLVQARQPT